MGDGEHEVVLHPLDAVPLAGVPLEGVGHLVEGVAQGGDLHRAPDLDPGLQIAASQAPGALDQPAEGRAHRVDQAGEQDQGGEQAADQAGRDEDRRVPGVVARFVLRGVPPIAGGVGKSVARRGNSRGPAPLARRRGQVAPEERLSDRPSPGALGARQLIDPDVDGGVGAGEPAGAGDGVSEAHRGPIELRSAWLLPWDRGAGGGLLEDERGAKPLAFELQLEVPRDVVLIVDANLKEAPHAEE
jgi:hypothetical protein